MLAGSWHFWGIAWARSRRRAEPCHDLSGKPRGRYHLDPRPVTRTSEASLLRNVLTFAAIMAVTLFPGCADDGPVPPLAPDPLAAEIRDLIEDLFASPQEGEALDRFEVIEDEIEGGSAPLDITGEQVAR